MITITVDSDAERDAMMSALYIRDFDYRIMQAGRLVVSRENGAYSEAAA